MLALAAGAAVAVVFAIGQKRQSEAAKAAYADMTAAINGLRGSLYQRHPTETNSSRALVEHLNPDDRPTPEARTAIWMDVHQTLVYYDKHGNKAAELPTFARVPYWVQPGCAQEEFRIFGAVLADVFAHHPGRELIVALAEITDHYSVVRIYDARLALLREMWNLGECRNVFWNAQSGLLVLTAYSNALPHYIPELAPCDSLDCPEQRRDPFVALAIRPENLEGVVYPLTGDAAHPPARVEWMLACIPPDRAAADPIPNADINAVDSPRDGHPGALGRVHVRVYRALEGPGRADWEDFFAYVGDDGERIEAFSTITGSEGTVVPRYQDSILTIRDVPLRAHARALAEPLLMQLGSEALVRARLEDERDISPELRRAALETLAAMAHNWRWLNNAASPIADAPGRSSGEYARALAWAQAAVDIHRKRCPNPDACVAGWYPENTLGMAQYRAGRFEEAVATLEAAQKVWAARHPENPERAEDLTYLAMANFRLGRIDAARAQLERTRRLMVPQNGPQPGDHGPPELREAEQVVGGG